MPKFRKGDIVSVKFVVESVFGVSDLRLRQADRYADTYAKESEVEMVLPHFETGDRVTWTTEAGRWSGSLLSVSNGHAWVDRGYGAYATVVLDKLSRLDPDPDFDEVEDLPVPPPEPKAEEVEEEGPVF